MIAKGYIPNMPFLNPHLSAGPLTEPHHPPSSLGLKSPKFTAFNTVFIHFRVGLAMTLVQQRPLCCYAAMKLEWRAHEINVENHGRLRPKMWCKYL